MGSQLVTDITQFGNRDIANFVTVIDAKETPFTSMVPKGSQNYGNILMEWSVDSNLDPEHTNPADGEDVTVFENAMPNYAQIQNYQQKFRPKGWQVGDIAENVQNLPGVASPRAKAMLKKLKQLKRAIEAGMCSDLAPKAWAADSGGISRGIGDFISATAQSVLPVPDGYRTVSGCIDTTASTSLTETIIQNVLQAAYQVTGQKEDRVAIAGPNHIKAYRGFMEKSSGSTNTMASNRTFTASNGSSTITWRVDKYEGDFGSLTLHPTLWNAYFDATTPTTTAASPGSAQESKMLARCYALNLSRWDWVGKRAPRNVDLIDEGGGPRGYVDAIGGLRCFNPKAEIKFAPTA